MISNHVYVAIHLFFLVYSPVNTQAIHDSVFFLALDNIAQYQNTPAKSRQ